jgi:MYXO-CTERM domain-containing protein
MKITLGIVAVAGLATVASAQLSTVSPNRTSAGEYGARATNYAWDDGTAENSVGLQNGGVLAAINAFPVIGGDNVITSVDVAWGTPAFAGQNGIVAGTPFNYYVWSSNAANDPSGANSTLLFAGSSTIAAANIDNNTFQSLAVPSIVIGSAIFFVGVDIAHPAGAFPLAVDQTAPTFGGASWAGGGAAFNPNNPGFNGGPMLDLAALGLGNWMIRANAVPTPGALALLGLGGLVAGRRRR